MKLHTVTYGSVPHAQQLNPYQYIYIVLCYCICASVYLHLCICVFVFVYVPRAQHPDPWYIFIHLTPLLGKSLISIVYIHRND